MCSQYLNAFTTLSDKRDACSMQEVVPCCFQVFFRLIEPFCSGVYAGDPTKLSMKAAFGKIHVLEGKGGSLVGGAIKGIQEKQANPGPPRDPKLPPKPAGATVGSFREGLQTLPIAIAAKLEKHIRRVPHLGTMN